MKKKLFLLMSLVVVFAMVFPAQAAPGPQIPLPGSALPQFIMPLPLLSAAGGPMQTVSGSSGPMEGERGGRWRCRFGSGVNPFLPGIRQTHW